MITIRNKNKTKIMLVIAAFMLASYAPDAQAMNSALEFRVTKISSYSLTGLPKIGYRKSQVEIDKEKAALKAKKTSQQVNTQRDSRTNFTEIYKRAGSKFGLDWRILAAVHSVETGQRGNTSVTSYAGAQGPMQFIPSTFRAYAQDGDGDGRALINDVDDAIFTAANYISRNKKVSGLDGALYRYNHSWSYVSKVKSIANSL